MSDRPELEEKVAEVLERANRETADLGQEFYWSSLARAALAAIELERERDAWERGCPYADPNCSCLRDGERDGELERLRRALEQMIWAFEYAESSPVSDMAMREAREALAHQNDETAA